MDYEEYKRKALEPIVNYIESAMASYSKEELEARIKKALPEKESEDERIRKHLIEIVETYWGKTNDPGKAADLAYLEKQKDQKWSPSEGEMSVLYKLCYIGNQITDEDDTDLTRLYQDLKREYFNGHSFENMFSREKQKEQKPLMCDGEIEDKKRDIVAAIRKHYPADYAEYLTSFLKGLSPEDNSEDEYGQKMLGIAYKLMYEHIPENLRTQEFWDSLKFMREYTGKVAIIHSYEQNPAEQLGGTFTSYDMAKTFTEGQNYVIAHPEKFGLCKPAEWSEEDETYLGIAINTVISAFGEDSHTVSWLKSFRPQPHWKPSEEQILALKYALGNGGKYDKEALESLYYDLQKL